MAHPLLPMQSIVSLIRRFGPVAFAALCLYPYAVYLLTFVLHAFLDASFAESCLLPYGICTFGILTRESFAELLRVVKNCYLTRFHLKAKDVFKRVSKDLLKRGGFHRNIIPLLNGGMLAGWEMALKNGAVILTVTAPWYRRPAFYFASLVLHALAVARSLRTIPETVWTGDSTVPSPLVAAYSFYTRPVSLKIFGGLMDLFYKEGLQIYTPGFITHKLCLDGLGCLYLFAGGLLPHQTVYLALGHLPVESVRIMCLELNTKFGLNGAVVADPSLAGPDSIRIVFPGKRAFFREILRGAYFRRIFRLLPPAA